MALAYDVDIYGPLVARSDVETAVVQTLETWMLAYVAAVERAHGLNPRTLPVPPATDSYGADLDFDAWEGTTTPQLIVAVQPAEPPLRTDMGTYNQVFEVQVAVQVTLTGDPLGTRLLADRYGVAVAALLTQQGDLSGIAEESMLAGYPRVEYPNPDVRDSARAVVTVHSLVTDVLDESAGPRIPPADPYAVPGGLPIVETTNVTVSVQQLPTS